MIWYNDDDDDDDDDYDDDDNNNHNDINNDDDQNDFKNYYSYGGHGDYDEKSNSCVTWQLRFLNLKRRPTL